VFLRVACNNALSHQARNLNQRAQMCPRRNDEQQSPGKCAATRAERRITCHVAFCIQSGHASFMWRIEFLKLRVYIITDRNLIERDISNVINISLYLRLHQQSPIYRVIYSTIACKAPRRKRREEKNRKRNGTVNTAGSTEFPIGARLSRRARRSRPCRPP